MNLFVTLTLQFSREDYSAVIKRMNTWLDNAVRRKGLKYILVPEYHDDERAIHFHGVMNRSALKCAESGQHRGRKVIYNFPEWKYGFSTVTEIDANGEEWLTVAKRIRDYMMKDLYGRVGGRWYLHGGALSEPIYRYYQADYFTANGNEYNINGTDYTYKLYRQRQDNAKSRALARHRGGSGKRGGKGGKLAREFSTLSTVTKKTP